MDKFVYDIKSGMSRGDWIKKAALMIATARGQISL